MPAILHIIPSDPAYLRAAFSVIGLSEIPGPKDEPKIIAMYAAAGHPEVKHGDSDVPWCAAFVGWALHEGKLPNTGSLLAHSYVKYGKRLDIDKKIPRGAICVWERTGGNHVNFALDDDGTLLTCLGGNQENGKGGGVTISKRHKNSGLIAAVMPPEPVMPIPVPKPVPPKPVVPEPKPVPPPVVKPAPEPKEPDPEPEEPDEDETPVKHSWYRRHWGKLASGFSLSSIVGVMTDPWVWFYIFLTLVVLILLAFAISLWLFGKESVKAWLKKRIG